jgi:hypothetical protein
MGRERLVEFELESLYLTGTPMWGSTWCPQGLEP